ncbi:MAG: radical SAM protein, partial [Pedobacter agri]
YELQDWFDFKIPRTKIAADFIEKALNDDHNFNTKPTAKVVWIGGKPSTEFFTKSKKGNTWEMASLTFHDKKESFTIQTNKIEGEWLASILEKIHISNEKVFSFAEVKTDFEAEMENFELFWYSKPVNTLRGFGLLVL